MVEGFCLAAADGGQTVMVGPRRIEQVVEQVLVILSQLSRFPPAFLLPGPTTAVSLPTVRIATDFLSQADGATRPHSLRPLAYLTRFW